MGQSIVSVLLATEVPQDCTKDDFLLAYWIIDFVRFLIEFLADLRDTVVEVTGAMEETVWLTLISSTIVLLKIVIRILSDRLEEFVFDSVLRLHHSVSNLYGCLLELAHAQLWSVCEVSTVHLGGVELPVGESDHRYVGLVFQKFVKHLQWILNGSFSQTNLIKDEADDMRVLEFHLVLLGLFKGSLNGDRG